MTYQTPKWILGHWAAAFTATVEAVTLSATIGAAKPVNDAVGTPASMATRGASVDLVFDIETWLDAHIPFASKPGAPVIRFIDADAAHALAPYTQREDLRIRGLYDPGLDTIYLVRPWSPEDLHDVSTLVHELVHRRQAGLERWACGGAEELSAYRIQEAWLNERGLTGRTNWFFVTQAAQCETRDIHP